MLNSWASVERGSMGFSASTSVAEESSVDQEGKDCRLGE
jgi:hypothetical protein